MRADETVSCRNISPDVHTAQHSEQQTQEESRGHGQQRAQQAVEEELRQLKGGVASDPHSVEAVRRDGLRDEILEAHLSRAKP